MLTVVTVDYVTDQRFDRLLTTATSIAKYPSPIQLSSGDKDRFVRMRCDDPPPPK